MNPTAIDSVSLDRRRLLTHGAASALALGLAGAAPGLAPLRAGRKLVLLQLSGGNDGLSAVVPFGDDAYHAARPELGMGASEVLGLDDYRGLHPELTRLFEAYSNGGLAIVEGVGYPDASRSHFRSMDVWHTADARGRGAGSGWIGRLAAEGLAAERDPNLVVHIGAEVPFSLHSETHPPASFVMPRSYRWAGGEAEVEAYERTAGREKGREAGAGSNLDYLRGMLRDGQSSSAEVRRAAAAYRTSVEYPRSPLGAALRDVAALVNGDIGTRVLSVEHGGFDTHNNQRSQQASRLRQLDEALGAFLEDLERSEAGRDTLVRVFSEFGRRVAENGTAGTDHGLAGPAFLAGHRVRGGLYGAHPSLTELDDGDLIHTTDFRRIYATVIDRWFGLDAVAVLGAEYAPLDLIETA